MMKYFKNLLSLIVVLLIVYFSYKTGHWDLLNKISFGNILYIFFLYLIFFIIIAIPLWRLLKNIGYEVPVLTIFNATILSNLFNLALPARGGTLYRGYFFKNKFDLSYREYIGISYFLSLGGLFTVGLYCLLVLVFYREIKIDLILGLSLAGLVYGIFPVLGLVFPKLLFKLSKKFRELMSEKLNWENIRTLENIIVTILGYFSSMGIYIVRVSFICSLFIEGFTFQDALILTCLNLAINLIQILPGNLGIKEASFAGIMVLLGYNHEIALLIALLDRAMQVISLGLLSSIILILDDEYLVLTKKFSKSKIEEISSLD